MLHINNFSTLAVIKNILGRLTSKWNTAQERYSEFKGMTIKTENREKTGEKKKKRLISITMTYLNRM